MVKCGQGRPDYLSPVKVFLAVDFAIPREAFFIENEPALCAANAVWVPWLLEHCQHVLVQDRLLTVRAHHQHGQVGHKSSVVRELEEKSNLQRHVAINSLVQQPNGSRSHNLMCNFDIYWLFFNYFLYNNNCTPPPFYCVTRNKSTLVIRRATQQDY